MIRNFEDNGHHKTAIYWSVRALIPSHGYEAVSPDGTVCGFRVCLPDVVEKVCKKRRCDYEATSASRADKLPIWC